MNEALAMFAYGWTRFQRMTTIIVGSTAIAFAFAGLAYLLDLPTLVIQVFGQLGLIGVFACFVLPLALFSMSTKSSMLDTVSGYDPWLLRLPISSWKLAAIPAFLVTVWLAVLWLTIAIPVRIWGGEDVPVFSQIMSMSSGAIFIYSLIWKPQRLVWSRFVLFVIAAPLAYASAFGCIIASFETPNWMPLVVAVSVVCYIASFAFAVFSVHLARVSSFQQVTKLKEVSEGCLVADVAPRVHKNQSAALAWYDANRARPSQIRTFAMIIPLPLFCAGILPLTGGTAIFGMVLTSAMCCVCAASMVEQTVLGPRSSLPSYLAASPLASREIAYSRLKSVTIAFISIMSLMSLTLLLNLAWRSNFETAERWWTNTVESLSVSAPIRIILFTYLCALVTSLGVFLRLICVQLFGRQSVVIRLTGLIVVAIVAPLVVLLRWFLNQTNWEDVTLVATSWLHWSYNLIYITLAIKVCVDVFIISRAETRLVSRKAKTQFVIGWCVLVIGAAVAAWSLWPASSFTFATALKAAAIVIPLSPFLLAPHAVAANRHRSIPIGSVARS